MSGGIACVIPVYNTERYLGEAIDSALAQTLPPEQVIVVDDGSTDGSADTARSFGDAVTVVSQPNAGTASARNQGLALADQPLVTFLDADDLFASNKLEKQAACLAEHPEAQLCVCRIRDFRSHDISDKLDVHAELSPQFRMGQVETWLTRREVFERIGGFDESIKFGEGPELFIRVQQANLSIVKVDDVLVERRLHDANKSRDAPRGVDAMLALLRRRLKHGKGAM